MRGKEKKRKKEKRKRREEKINRQNQSKKEKKKKEHHRDREGGGKTRAKVREVTLQPQLSGRIIGAQGSVGEDISERTRACVRCRSVIRFQDVSPAPAGRNFRRTKAATKRCSS